MQQDPLTGQPLGQGPVDPLTGEPISSSQIAAAENAMAGRANDSRALAGDAYNIEEAYGEDTDGTIEQPIASASDREEYLAREQTAGTKFTRGLGRAGVTFGTAVAENTLGLVVNTASALYGLAAGEEEQGWIDNSFTRYMDELREASKESMPIYESELEKENFGVLPGTTGSANFWFQHVFDGAAFSLAAMTSALLPGGVGVAAARGAGRLASRGIKAGADYARAAQNIGGAMKQSPQFMEMLKSSPAWLNKVEDASGWLAKSASAALAESGMEARELKNRLKDNLYKELLAKKRLENPGVELPEITEEELAQIDEYVSAATNANFLVNLVAVGGGQAITFGKMLSPKFATASKRYNNITKKGDVWKETNIIPRKGRVVPEFFNRAGAEALQEGTQTTSSEALFDYYKQKQDNYGTADLMESVGNGIDHTFGTKEGLTSLLVGGIVGGIFGGITLALETGDRAKKNAATDMVLKYLNDDSYKEARAKAEGQNAVNQYASLSEQALKANDRIGYEYGKFGVLKALGEEYWNKEGYDVLEMKLNDIESLPKEEFEKIFGEIEEGQTPRDVVRVLKDRLQDMKDVHQVVDSTFKPSLLDNTIFDYFVPKTAKEARKQKEFGANMIRTMLKSTLMDAHFFDSLEEELLGEINKMTGNTLSLGTLRDIAIETPFNYLETSKEDLEAFMSKNLTDKADKDMDGLLTEKFQEIDSKYGSWKELMQKFYQSGHQRLKAKEIAFLKFADEVVNAKQSASNALEFTLLADKLSALFDVYKSRETVTEMFNRLLTPKGQRKYIQDTMQGAIDEIEGVLAGNLEAGSKLKEDYIRFFAEVFFRDNKFQAPYESPFEQEEEILEAEEVTEDLPQSDDTEPVEGVEEHMQELDWDSVMGGPEAWGEDLTGNSFVDAEVIKAMESAHKARGIDFRKANKAKSVLTKALSRFNKNANDEKLDNRENWKKGARILKAAINSYQTEISLNKDNVLPLPRINTPHTHLDRIFTKEGKLNQASALEIARLANLKGKDLYNSIFIKLAKYPGKMPKAQAGEAKVLPGVMGENQLAIQVYAQETPNAEPKMLGVLLDPFGVKIKEGKGFVPLDTNNTKHLAAVNPGFVEKDGSISYFGDLWRRRFETKKEAFKSVHELKEGEMIPLAAIPNLGIHKAPQANTKRFADRITNKSKLSLLDYHKDDAGSAQMFDYTTRNNEARTGIFIYSNSIEAGRNPVARMEKDGTIVPMDNEDSIFITAEGVLDSPNVSAFMEAYPSNYIAIINNGGVPQAMPLDMPQMQEAEEEVFMQEFKAALDNGEFAVVNDSVFISGPRAPKTYMNLKYMKGAAEGLFLEIRSKEDSKKSVNITLYDATGKFPYGIKKDKQGDYYIDLGTEKNLPLSISNIVKLANNQLAYNIANAKSGKVKKKSTSDWLLELEKAKVLNILPQDPNKEAPSFEEYYQKAKVATSPETKFHFIPAQVKPNAPEAVVVEKPPAPKPSKEDLPPPIDETKPKDEDNKASGNIGDLFSIAGLDDKIDQILKLSKLKADLSRFINVEDTFTVEELETVDANLKTGEIPVGAFIDGAIKLANKYVKGTEYHEAFHAVVRTLLSPEEYRFLINDAKKAYKNPTKEELQQIRDRYENYNLSDVDIKDIFYEEKLADAFQAYVLNQDTRTGFQRFFDRILRMIQSFFGQDKSLEKMYDKIYRGKFKNMPPNRNRKSNVELLSILKTKIEVNGQWLFSALPSKYGDRIATDVAMQLYKSHQGSTTLSMLRFDEVLDRVANTYYNPVAWEEQLEKIPKEIRQTKKAEITRVYTALTDEQVKAENIAKIRTAVHKKLRNLLEYNPLQEVDPLEEELGNREIFDKDQTEVDPVNKLNSKIRYYIDNLTDVVDEFGIAKYLNDEDIGRKFLRPVDGYSLYHALLNGLAGVSTKNLLDEFEILALNSNNRHVKKFYEIFMGEMVKEFKRNLGQSEDLVQLGTFEDFGALQQVLTPKDYENSMLYMSFRRAFDKERIDLADIVYDNVSKEAYLVYASTRAQADHILSNVWLNKYLQNPITDAKIAQRILDDLSRAMTPEDFLKLRNPEIGVEVSTISETDYLAYIQHKLGQIGIYVTPEYIKHSLVWALNNENLGELTEAEEERYQELLKFHDNRRSNFYALSKDAVVNNKRLGGTLLSNIKAGKTQGLLNPREEEGKHSRSLLTKIAMANAPYASEEQPVTLRNGEGKQIFTIVDKNFLMTETKNWGSPRRLAFLDKLFNAEEEEEVLKEELEALLEADEAGFPLKREENPFFIDWYYNTLKNNPLIQSGTYRDVLTNLDNGNPLAAGAMRLNLVAIDAEGNVTSTEQDRYQGAKPHKSLDPAEKAIYDLALQINAYTEQKAETQYSPVMLGINEAKSMNNIVTAPVNRLYNNNGITVEARRAMYHVLKGEFERIKLFGNEDYFTKHLANLNPDGFLKNRTKFFYFSDEHYEEGSPALEFLNNLKQQEELEDWAEGNAVDIFLQQHLETIINTDIDKLTSPKHMIASFNADGVLVSDIIPSTYMVGETGQVDTIKISNFFLNSYINNIALRNLIEGDPGVVYPNALNQTKRGGQRIGAGTNLGFGDANIYIDPEFKEPIALEGVEGTKDVSTNDGQAEGSWASHVKYVKAEGLWEEQEGMSVPKILRKVRKGRKLNDAEVTFLEKKGASMNPLKLVFTGRGTYYKLSVAPLSLQEVAYYRRKDIEQIDAIFEEIERLDAEEALLEAYQGYFDTLYGKDGRPGLFKPRDHAKDRFNRYVKMERENIHYRMDASASKMFSVINQKIKHPFAGVRKQQVTDSEINKINDPTQKTNNIWTEQLTEAITYFAGKKVKAGDISQAYQNQLAARVAAGFKKTRETLLDEQGKAKYQQLLERFQESARESGTSVTLQEMLSLEEGFPEYDINFPLVFTKIQSMFLSYVNNGTLKQKVNGTKLILRSDYLYNIPTDEEGNPTLHSKKPAVSFRRLKHRLKDSNGQYYSEVAVSEAILHKVGLRIGDEIPENLLTFFGVRIPTEDKRSMGTFKIAAILPGHYGKTVIVPPEIIRLSGADFDIDAIYAQFPEVYRDETTKKPVVYGSYLSKTGIHIGAAYKEIVNYTKAGDNFKYESTAMALRDPAIKALNKDISDSSEVILENYSGNFFKDYRTLTIELAEDALKLDTLERRAILDLMDSDAFVESSPIESLINLEKEITSLFALIDDSERSMKLNIMSAKIRKKFNQVTEATTQDEIDILRDNIDKKQAALNQIENKVLTKLLGFSTEKEFEAKHGAKVKANVTAFNNGNISAIRPLTIPETSNFLLEAAKTLLHTSDNLEIAQNESSNDTAGEIKDEVYGPNSKVGLKDEFSPPNVASFSGMITAMEINSLSKALTGVAASQAGIYSLLGSVEAHLPNGRPLVTEEGLAKGQYITPGENRILGTIAMVLATVVDDAKYNYSARLNWSRNNLAAVIFLSTSQGEKDAILINMQPANQILNAFKNQIRSNLISTDFNERELKERVMNELVIRYPKPEKEEIVTTNLGNYWLETLAYSNGTTNMAWSDFMAIQEDALDMMIDAMEQAEEVGKLRKVTALIRGDYSSFAKLEGTLDEFNKNFVIQEGKARFVEKEEEASLWDKTLERFYNIPYVLENIKTVQKISQEVAPEFFITATPLVKTTLNSLRKSLRIDNDQKAQEDLDKQMLAFLLQRAFANTEQKYTLDELHLTDELQQDILDLLSTKTYSNNAFLKFLKDNFSKETINWGNMKGKTIYKVGGNNRLNPDSTFTQDLSADVVLLVNTNPLILKDGRTITPTDVMRKLIAYLVTKNGINYTSDTFATNILPIFLGKSITKITDIHNAIKENKLADYLNEPVHKTMQDFVQLYNRYTVNKKNIATIWTTPSRDAQQRWVDKNMKGKQDLKGAMYPFRKSGGTLIVSANTPYFKAIQAITHKRTPIFRVAEDGIYVPTHLTMGAGKGNRELYELNVATVERVSKQFGKQIYTLNYKDRTAYLKGAPNPKNLWDEVTRNNIGIFKVVEANYEIVDSIGTKDINPYYFAEEMLSIKPEDDFSSMVIDDDAEFDMDWYRENFSELVEESNKPVEKEEISSKEPLEEIKTIKLKDGNTYNVSDVNSTFLETLGYTPEEINEILKNICE